MQASIQSRLAGAMREQGMRSLLLADPENFGYVAGPMLPYVKQTPDRAVLALFEPGTDEAACTCWLYPDLAQPAEAQLAKEPSAVCVAVAEDAVGADCLIPRLKESRPDLDGVVGVDFSQTAASVFDALRAAPCEAPRGNRPDRNGLPPGGYRHHRRDQPHGGRAFGQRLPQGLLHRARIHRAGTHPRL